MERMERYMSQEEKSESFTKLLIWTTRTELSVLIDDKYYKREVTREELLRLAEHFLNRALERAPE